MEYPLSRGTFLTIAPSRHLSGTYPDHGGMTDFPAQDGPLSELRKDGADPEPGAGDAWHGRRYRALAVATHGDLQVVKPGKPMLDHF